MTDGSEGDEGWDRDLRLPLHGTHVLTPVHASQLRTASSSSISDDWSDSDSDDDWDRSDRDEPAPRQPPATAVSASAPAPAPGPQPAAPQAATAAVGTARVLVKPQRAPARPRVLERTCSMRVHGRAGAALPSAISAATVRCSADRTAATRPAESPLRASAGPTTTTPSSRRLWRLSLPPGAVEDTRPAAGDKKTAETAGEERPVVTGIRADPGQTETDWEDDFAFGPAPRAAEETGKKDTGKKDDDDGDEEEDEDWDAELCISEHGSAPRLGAGLSLDLNLDLNDDEDDENDDSEGKKKKKREEKDGEERETTKNGEEEARGVQRANRLLEGALGSPVTMVAYPAPPQLWTLRFASGHAAMGPEDTEAWLAAVVAKHVGSGALAAPAPGTTVAAAAARFAAGVAACGAYTDEWFVLHVQQARVLCALGARDAAWRLLEQFFCRDVQHFADTLSSGSSSGGSSSSGGNETPSAERVYALFCLCAYALECAVPLLSAARAAAWKSMLCACQALCPPLAPLLYVLHCDCCLDTLMAGDDDAVAAWEAADGISHIVARLAAVLDAALAADHEAQAQAQEQAQTQGETQGADGSSSSNSTTMDPSVFPLMCACAALCSLHLAAAGVSPLRYVACEHYPEEEDVAAVFAARAPLLGSEAARERFLAAAYARLPAQSPVKARVAYTLAARAAARGQDWPAAERAALEALFVLDTALARAPDGPAQCPLVASELGLQTLLLCGAVLLHNGKYRYAILCDEAALLLADALQRRDYFRLAQRVLQVCRAHSDFDRCVRLYAELAARYQAARRTNEALFALVLLADLYADRGCFGEAEDTLLRALRVLLLADGPDARSSSSSSSSSTSPELRPLGISSPSSSSSSSPTTSSASAGGSSTGGTEGLEGLDVQGVGEMVQREPRCADVLFRLAALYLRSYALERGVELLDVLRTCALPPALHLRVLAALAPAYAKKGWFVDACRTLHEIPLCSAATAAAVAPVALPHDAVAYVSPEALWSASSSSSSTSSGSSTGGGSGSGGTALIAQRQDAESTLASLRLLRRCYSRTRHHACALYTVDYALAFCPETLLTHHGKLLYQRGCVLAAHFREAAALKFPATLSCIAPEIRSVFRLPTVVPRVVVFARATDILQEAAAALTRAYRCFSTVGDDVHIARTMAALADLYLDQVFVPVAFRGVSFDDASTFPAFDSSTSSTSTTTTSSASGSETSNAASPPLVHITAQMIENPAQLALDLASQFYDARMQPGCLLSMAELRFVQGARGAAREFWQESRDVFWRLFMADCHCILARAPAPWVARACRFVERLARLLLCLGADFVRAHTDTLDACLLLQAAAARAAKRPLGPAPAPGAPGTHPAHAAHPRPRSRSPSPSAASPLSLSASFSASSASASASASTSSPSASTSTSARSSRSASPSQPARAGTHSVTPGARAPERTLLASRHLRTESASSTLCTVAAAGDADAAALHASRRLAASRTCRAATVGTGDTPPCAAPAAAAAAASLEGPCSPRDTIATTSSTSRSSSPECTSTTSTGGECDESSSSSSDAEEARGAWLRAREAAAEELWSLLACMKAETRRFLGGGRARAEHCAAMRECVRCRAATADECRAAHARATRTHAVRDYAALAARHAPAARRVLYVLALGHVVATYAPATGELHTGWLGPRQWSAEPSSSSSGATAAAAAPEYFSEPLVGYLISLLHAPSTPAEPREGERRAAALAELARVFQGVRAFAAATATTTQAGTAGAADAAAVTLSVPHGRFGSLRGLFGGARSAHSRRASVWVEQTAAPLVLLCSDALQVVPWELLVPGDTVLRYPALDTLLQIASAAAVPAPATAASSSSSVPLFVCLYNHHSERHVCEERRRELLFAEVQERFLDGTRVAEAGAAASLDGCLQTPLAEDTKKGVAVPRRKHKGCVFWDAHSGSTLDALWRAVAAAAQRSGGTGAWFPVVLVTYADLCALAEPLVALLERHPQCALLAVPARAFRAVAARLFAAAETFAACTRLGRGVLAAPRLAGPYQALMNVVAAARLDGVPLCVLCGPLPRPC